MGPMKHLLEVQNKASLSLWLDKLCRPWPPFHILIPYTVSRTPWTWDQPVARPLTLHENTNLEQTYTCKTWVGFEPTIPVFEREKTVHDLELAAAVIGESQRLSTEMYLSHWFGNRKHASITSCCMKTSVCCFLHQTLIIVKDMKLWRTSPSISTTVS
jgi:hypothetical protein